MGFDITTAVPVSGQGTSSVIPTTKFDFNSAVPVYSEVKSKPGAISSFVRDIMKNTMIEKVRTAVDLAGEANKGTLPKPQRGESFDKWFKRIEGQREEKIKSEGVAKQIEAPMAGAIAVAAIADPVGTAVGVGMFSVADHFFNARRWIEDKAPQTNPTIKDVAEIADFVVKGVALGFSIPKAKAFVLDRMSRLNLPKAVVVPPETFTDLRGKSDIVSKLEITPEIMDASINSGTPVQVPMEKAIDLALETDWVKTKEKLGLEKPAEAKAVQKVEQDVVKSEQPIAKTPEGKPIEIGEPTEKVRGLSLSTEASAIEKGLTEDINPALPRYQVRPIKKIAEELAQKDKQELSDVVFGKKPVPEGYREEEFYSALRTKAMQEGDFVTLKDLATSDFVSSMATESGQRVKALDVSERRDPIKAIQEIVEVRNKETDSRLKAAKTRWIKAQKQLEQKLEQLNFETEPRRKLELDAEATQLKTEVDTLRKAFQAGKKVKETITDDEAKGLVDLSKDITEKEAIMNESPRRGMNDAPTKEEMDYGLSLVAFDNYFNDLKFGNKLFDIAEYKKNPIKFIEDFTGTSKSLVSSLDNSFIGRQGINLFFKGITGDFASGKIWMDTFNKSFQTIWDTFGGKPVMNQIRAEILSDPMYPLLKKAGIDTAVTEEAFPTSIVSKIPVIGKPFLASENAYVGSAHYMRYKLGKLELDIAEKAGVDLADPMELASIGKLVNSLTGRGDIGSQTKLPTIINNTMFSPRKMKADLDVLTAHLFDRNVSGYVKQRAAWNLARLIVGQAMILGIAKMIRPDSVEENDPHSADFGKIKIDNTRFDISAGKLAYITLATRLLPLIFNQESYIKSSTTGKKNVLNTGKYGKKDGMEVLYDFMENKTSPTAKVIIDRFRGEDFDGNKPTLKSSALGLVTPFPVETADELLNEPGAADFLGSMIASSIGISVNTYSDKKSNKKF